MAVMRSLALPILAVLSVICSPAQPPKKRVLAIGTAKGFQHEATSHGLATIWKLGQETGLWDTFIRTDTELLTKKPLENNAKNLDYFDAVVFYTSGELELDDSQKNDLLSFIRDDGKGFIGAHSAADTLYQWPEYGEMLGGYFDHHPWNTFQAPMLVEDSEHPIVKHFPAEFTVHDEIYQFRNYSRDRLRVLLRLDAKKLDLQNQNVHRTDGDFAVAWMRNYGNGRVFYSTLGHMPDSWERPDVQKMWLEAIRWALGLIDADATPRPLPAN